MDKTQIIFLLYWLSLVFTVFGFFNNKFISFSIGVISFGIASYLLWNIVLRED